MHLQPLPALDDNYIWTLGTAGGGTIVVDPGEAAPVLAAAALGLRPTAIVLTHHHGDHIGGVGELLARWPDVPVFAPHDDRIVAATVRVGDGDGFDADGIRFETIAVPGHTSSHVAFVCDGAEGEPLLFSGDTLFSLGCGRLFEGTPAQMLASLDRLAALPGDIRVCCGHEYTQSNAAFARAVDPDNHALRRRIEEVNAMRADGLPTLPSRLSVERDTNPFLRVDDAAIVAAASAHADRALSTRVDVFAELRHWKDGFRG